MFWPVSKKYIYEIYEGLEMHRHFQADTLLFTVTVEDLNLYEDTNILGTHYIVLLNASLGAWQGHNTSMHLIFSGLHADDLSFASQL